MLTKLKIYVSEINPEVKDKDGCITSQQSRSLKPTRLNSK